MNINEVNQNSFSKVIALLKSCGLPTEDISDTTKLFFAVDGNEILGTIGIEFYDDVALLRSLAVIQEKQGQGLGKQLVEFIEVFAKQSGAKELILLTTSAEEFFIKNFYHVVEKNSIPGKIKQSSEFTSTCPSTAIAMKKVL
jgi:amino-acid N-acetyltransferase